MAPEAAGAVDALALAEWTVVTGVTHTVTGGGFTETFRATYVDADTAGYDSTWTGSRTGSGRFACINGGFNGYDISGNGTGSGQFSPVSVLPGYYGLASDQSWTPLGPAVIDGDYALSGTTYTCNGESHDGQMGSETPWFGAAFLPGTIEELNALPVGSVLSNSYQRVEISTSVATTTVTFTAVKGVVDRDGDGVADSVDECPDDPGSPTHAGCPDTDGDGRSDIEEGATSATTGVDTDSDGTPDFLDIDSDDDGLSDAIEGDGDQDGDGIPDWRDPPAVNQPPVANDVAVSTGPGQPVSASLGITDPDDDSFTVACRGIVGWTITVVGDVVTVTPALGFSGTMNVDCTATDDNGGTAAATVTVTVVRAVCLPGSGQDSVDDFGAQRQETRWDASFQAVIRCNGSPSGYFRQSFSERAQKGSKRYDWDDQSEIEIAGRSFATWRQAKGVAPFKMCIVDEWFMTIGEDQNAATAPFFWTETGSSTTWNLRPTVGPLSSLQATTCSWHTASVSLVTDLATVGISARTGLGAEIDSITHVQTAFVYSNEQTVIFTHRIQDTIEFD